MISRLKPYFDYREAKAMFYAKKGSVDTFEENFAKFTGADYALSFAYGRSALYASLKALGIKSSEVLMPAYSCVVVPNAIVVSGNTPQFVDSDSDFNTSAKSLSKAIAKKTKAVIPTNMFGYQLGPDEFSKLKKKTLVIQDNALSLRTKNQGDLNFYSLTWSKHLSTIEGGVLTTNNKKYFEKIRKFRDLNFRKPSFASIGTVSAVTLLSNAVFNKDIFAFVHSLEKNKIINPYSKYFNEEKVTLPGNFNEFFSEVQARVGLEQLKKAPEIIEKRINLAKRYSKKLQEVKEKVRLPKLVKGATYSHYCLRVRAEDRNSFVEKMEDQGVNVGTLFDYSLPYLKPFRKHKGSEFESSLKLSKEVVNLPLYPSLTRKEQDFIIEKTINSTNKLR